MEITLEALRARIGSLTIELWAAQEENERLKRLIPETPVEEEK